jgi:hypothetical protein
VSSETEFEGEALESLAPVDPIIKEFMNDSSKFFRTRSTHFVTVCPDGAKVLLKHNTDNRPVTRDNVNYLARDMENDQWVDWVTDITFTVDRALSNAQHQLLAVIKTGKPIKARVTFGLPSRALVVQDTGRLRTQAEAARIAGFALEHEATFRSFATQVQFIDHPNILAGGRAEKITNQDYLAWLRENAVEVEPAVKAGVSLNANYGVRVAVGTRNGVQMRWQPRLSKTEAAICWYILAHVAEPELVDAFFSLLKDGTRTGYDDPLTALDRALDTLKAEGSPGFWRRVSVVMHAWNYWAACETLTIIKHEAYFNTGHRAVKPKPASALRRSTLGL